MREQPITIGATDAQRLRQLLRSRDATARDQEHLHELSAELERAHVLESARVPTDVVTMGSRVQVLDRASGQRREYILAFPADADLAARRISVLAPLGTAMLGFREGDEVEWLMPGGLRRLRIESVTQPAHARPFAPAFAARHAAGSLVA
jgi:regulator of nucleoside diphosphate kinase